MERTESVRKVNIREEITEIFSEFEESLQAELHETGFTIMEEVENHYKDISLNQEAIPQLLLNIKNLLKELPKQLLIHKGGIKSLESPLPRLKFKEFIETKHTSIDSAIINLESLNIFVTGDPKGQLIIWDKKTMKEIFKHNFDSAVHQFVFDSKEQRLIIAFESSTSKEFLKSFKISSNGLDVSSGTSFECPESVLNLQIIEKERKVVIEDSAWRIHIWDLDTSKYILDLKIEGDQWFPRGEAIGYLPESKLIIIPGADKQIPIVSRGKKAQDNGTSTLRFFNIETGELAKEIPVNFKTIVKIILEENRLVLVDLHGSLIFLNSSTLKEEARIEFEENQILDAVYSKSLDLLVCTTESPVVALIKFSEAKVIRKLHPKATRCEKSVLYFPEEEKALVTFQLDESEVINIGVLELEKEQIYRFN